MKPVLLAVFAVSAALLTVAPTGAGSLNAENDGIRVELRSEPERPATNARTRYVVKLLGPTGESLVGAQITLSGGLGNGTPVVGTFRPTPEAGVYQGEVVFRAAGRWSLWLIVERQGRRLELPLRERVGP
jgi:hypothetical protein